MKKSFPLIFTLFVYFTFLGGSLYSLTNFPLKVFNHALVTLILGVWLWNRFRQPKENSALHPLLIGSLSCWLGAQLIAAALSVDPRISFEGLWQPITHAIAFLMLLDLWPRYRGHFVKALYLSGAVVCLIGLAEFMCWYFGIPLLAGFQQGWPEIGGWNNPLPPYWYRLNFTLTGATSLSAYLALLIPPAIGLWLTNRRKDDRQSLAVWLILAMPVLILTFSRGGILALGVSLPIVGVGWLTLKRPQFLSKFKFLQSKLIRGIVGLALILGLLGLGFFQQKMAAHSSGDQVRLNLWQSAAQMTLDHPLTGVGPKLYGRMLRLYRDPALARDQITTAHNLYLNTAAETGLPGLLAGGLLIGAVIFLGWKTWQSAPGNSAKLQRLSVAAALLGFGAQNMVDTYSATPIILPAMLGASFLISPQSTGEKPVSSSPRWLIILLPTILAGYTFFLIKWDIAQYYFEQATTTPAAAIENIEQALNLDPQLTLYRTELAYYQGILALSNPAYLPQAISGYQTSLAIEETNPIYHANLAALLRQAGQPAKAVATIEKALSLPTQSPGKAIFLLNLGQFWEQEGDQANALTHYAQAIEVSPALLDSGLWDATQRQELIDALSHRTNNPTLMSKVALANQDFTGAETLAREAIAAAPNDESIHIILAQAMLEQGNAAAAEKLATERIPLASPAGLGELYFIRGRARLKMNADLPAEAIDDLRTALFIDPFKYASAYFYLGQIDEANGALDQAEIAYRRAVTPQFVSQNYEVVLYGRTGNHAPFLPQLIAPTLTQTQIKPWLRLIELYKTEGKLKEAAQLQRQLQKLFPSPL